MPKRMAGMSPAAAQEFLEGVTYIAERNPEAARRLVKQMRALRERIIDFPDIGVRGEIRGTRRMVLKPFVLTVRQGKDGIEIVAVRHEKQKDAYRPAELLEEDEVAPPPSSRRF